MSKLVISEDKFIETTIIDIIQKYKTHAFCTNEITEWFTNKLKVSGHIFLELMYQRTYESAEDALSSDDLRFDTITRYEKELGAIVRIYPIKTSFLPPTAIVDSVKNHNLFNLLVLENKDSNYGTIIGICAAQSAKQETIAPKTFVEEKELIYFGKTGVLKEANRIFKGHSIKLAPSKAGGEFLNPWKHLERSVEAHPDWDPMHYSGDYIKHVKDTYGLIEFSPIFDEESIL